MFSQHQSGSTRPTSHRIQNAPRRSGINPWVPNQHGAWAMLLAPPLVGALIALGYQDPSHIHHRSSIFPIAVAWIIGYFSFFSFGLWFKARSATRKAKYARPMIVYGTIAAVAGITALFTYPGLAWWALAFTPMVAVAVLEVFRRRQRSLSSGIATTIASATMLLVMASTGEFAPLPWFFFNVPARIWVLWLATALYYVGTIFYVKTMIREKGNAPFENLSRKYHAIAFTLTVLAALAAIVSGDNSPVGSMVAVMVMAAAWGRSVAIPARARHNPTRWSPKQVGLLEIPLVLALIAAGIALI